MAHASRPKQVGALRHGEKRVNIPTAEMQSFFQREEDRSPLPPKRYERRLPLADAHRRFLGATSSCVHLCARASLGTVGRPPRTSTGRLSGKAVFSTQLADPEGSQRFSASLSVRGPDTGMAPAPPVMRRM